MNTKQGFTLAEVLITLGIIGVVAAMTLPVLVGKYKEKQHITQLQKVYSILSQAFKIAVLEHGEPQYWGLTTSNTNEKDENGNTIVDKSGQIQAANIFKKYVKQMPNNKSDREIRKYLSLDGREDTTTAVSTTSDNGNILYLADGTVVTFGWTYEGCTNDFVECGDIAVNFPEKTAQLGINRFFFYLSPKGVMPYGHKDHIRSFKDYCDITNSTGKGSNEQGRGCTAWVISNNNMDYLHCTGLDWDSKTSCK